MPFPPPPVLTAGHQCFVHHMDAVDANDWRGGAFIQPCRGHLTRRPVPCSGYLQDAFDDGFVRLSPHSRTARAQSSAYWSLSGPAGEQRLQKSLTPGVL